MILGGLDSCGTQKITGGVSSDEYYHSLKLSQEGMINCLRQTSDKKNE